MRQTQCGRVCCFCCRVASIVRNDNNITSYNRDWPSALIHGDCLYSERTAGSIPHTTALLAENVARRMAGRRLNVPTSTKYTAAYIGNVTHPFIRSIIEQVSMCRSTDGPATADRTRERETDRQSHLSRQPAPDATSRSLDIHHRADERPAAAVIAALIHRCYCISLSHTALQAPLTTTARETSILSIERPAGSATIWRSDLLHP